MNMPGNAPLSRSLPQLTTDPVARPQAVGVAAAEQPAVRPGVRQDAVRLLAIVAQLSLLALVIRQFGIESAAFFQLSVLAFAGFVVHALLPMRFRLPSFAALSLAGIALVLGPQAGAILVGIGLALVGICHLPAPFSVRVGALALAGAGLALMRANLITAPWTAAIWPILGSMFMFRLGVYLYDLKHDTEPPSVARALSYFFLLPNVCFPLFPVVDFKTFRRTYFNDDQFRIYQNGVRWMFRGIVQLVLYRVVYQHLTMSAADVQDVPGLVQYLTANFLLYLRVSGSFHLIVGMLHLYGFNLPPTHYLFYLASSFNDFWRRINIYWKDFMMKLFYYPAYFKLRKLGATTALVISTVIVFLSTWVLHSYQWFWLRGTFPLNWQDGAFWGVLAVLVVANSLHEARHGRARSLSKRTWTAASLAGHSLRTLGTFCVICVLWSLWTSESLGEWLSLWSLPGGWGTGMRAFIPILVCAVIFAGAWMTARAGASSAGAAHGAAAAASAGFWRPAVVTGLSILALAAVGERAVYSRVGVPDTVMASVTSPRLNAREASRLEAGYYEGLLRVDRFNSQLWEVYMRNPVDVNDWGESGRTVRWTTDFRMKELRPNLRTHLRDWPFTTNEWGMRDQPYSKVPAPGTRRIALLGSSVVMGSGVSDGENFESLIEARLNREHAPEPFQRYEILNFSVGGYGPLEQVGLVDQRLFAFEPTGLIFISHWSDTGRSITHLAKAVTRGIDVPYNELRRIADAAGIDRSVPQAVAEARLAPFGAELASFAYRHIASICRARGITPIWIYVPVLRDQAAADEPGDLARLAREAGFEVLDLSNVFDGLDRSRLKVSEADYHPNREGHMLIADRMYRELMELDARRSHGLFTTMASRH
jgi:hypothetical protein